MARPTVRDVHIDQPLTNISIAYRNDKYIADQIFPIVPVAKKSDVYFVFDKGAWFRDEAQLRSPGTRAQRSDYALTTASYVCLNYALGKPVPDETRDNADAPLRPSIEAAEFVADKLELAMERRVATLITTAANWATSSSPTTQWSSDTSDPFNDIDGAVDGVISSIGQFPNVAVMSWDVWRRLKNHPDLLDRVKFTRPGGSPEVTDIAGWFGLDKVLVGLSLYDSAEEGQTASMTYIWGDDFWVGYVPQSPALMTPAAGYVFRWKTREVRQFREDQEYTDVFTGNEYLDEVITACDAGSILYDCV